MGGGSEMGGGCSEMQRNESISLKASTLKQSKQFKKSVQTWTKAALRVGNQVDMNASALFDNDVDAASLVDKVTFLALGLRVSRSDVPV